MEEIGGACGEAAHWDIDCVGAAYADGLVHVTHGGNLVGFGCG